MTRYSGRNKFVIIYTKRIVVITNTTVVNTANTPNYYGKPGLGARRKDGSQLTRNKTLIRDHPGYIEKCSYKDHCPFKSFNQDEFQGSVISNYRAKQEVMRLVSTISAAVVPLGVKASA